MGGGSNPTPDRILLLYIEKIQLGILGSLKGYTKQSITIDKLSYIMKIIDSQDGRVV